MAKDKLLGEEVIHELSNKTLGSYSIKAKQNIKSNEKTAKKAGYKEDEYKTFFSKRREGIKRAEKKMSEEVVQEMRFDDGKEGTAKRKEALRKKRGMTKAQMDKHPQFKDDVKEGSSYGITRGSGKPSGPMAAFGKKKKEEEEKAPRMQKGAMAYDGPNKERSEAADRVLAKAKKKREKMKEEYVDEAKMKMKAKPKNPKDMSKGVGQAAPVDYRTLAQSYAPVGNIFNEKKLDAVGAEDKDIDNDGDHDSTDKYLLKRRKAIGKAIAKKRGRVKEGFSCLLYTSPSPRD